MYFDTAGVEVTSWIPPLAALALLPFIHGWYSGKGRNRSTILKRGRYQYE